MKATGQGRPNFRFEPIVERPLWRNPYSRFES
jgi:hypothetical protein